MPKTETKSDFRRSRNVVTRELRRLRQFIEDKKSPVNEARIAYAMEEAIRWCTEKTVGWGTPLKVAQENAAALRVQSPESRTLKLIRQQLSNWHWNLQHGHSPPGKEEQERMLAHMMAQIDEVIGDG